jgi:hypothetical protein
MSFNTDFYADNVFTTSAVVGTSATVDSQGIRVAGVVTATSFVGDIVGAAVTTDSEGIRVAGVVTATSFVGDGSGLSGVESWNQQDTWLYGGG